MTQRLLTGAAALVLAVAVWAADPLRDATDAFQHGDFATAEKLLKEVLRTEPNHPLALGLLGAVYDSEKKFAAADPAYRRAIQLLPDSVPLLNNYGNHLVATGHYAEAREDFLKVLKLEPTHANANVQMAFLALNRKNAAEALLYLDRLPPLDKAPPQVVIMRMQALYLAGRIPEAEALLARLSASAAQNPKAAYSAATALAASGRHAEAEKLFSVALEANPGNFVVLQNLGLAALHAGHLQRAQEVFKQAMGQRPNDVDTIYNLALVEIDLNQREAAVPLLARAVALDPSRVTIQLTLAQTANAIASFAEAVAAYDAYLKLAPADETAQREHAFLLALTGPRDRGLPDLEKFLRSHPRDATAQYEMGVVESSSDPADAARHLDQAIRLQPELGAGYFGRGTLNYQRDNLTAALPDLELAAQKLPDNPAVLDRLGGAYLQIERFPDAVRTLRKAARIAPNDALVLMHLSRALTESGQKDEARAVFERVRAIGPEHLNRLPSAADLELLTLPPVQLYAGYRAAIEERVRDAPHDPAANLADLKLLLEDGKLDEAGGIAARLLGLQPPAALAAEAGHALLDSEQYTQAKPLLEYAATRAPGPAVWLDLAEAKFHVDSTGLLQLDRIPEAERSGDYYLARAQMLEQSGKLDQALAAFHRALDASPTRPLLYAQTADFLVRHQLPEEAVHLLEVGARAIPGDREIRLLQAAMLAFAGHADQAEGVLRRLQNRWPEWSAPYVTYGILLDRGKRAAEARTQLDMAIALGASGPEAFFYSAKADLESAPVRLPDASKAIARALSLAPANAAVQALAGSIDYRRGDYAAALEHLRESIRLRPNSVKTRSTLAEVYKALGQTENSSRETQEIERLKQSGPRGPDEEDVPPFPVHLAR